MLPGRASGLSLIVHAVEPTGAVCGARPRDGRWRLSQRLPVNCPRCLVALSVPRFALCWTLESSRAHVRLIGMRGFKPSSGPETRTLCGAIPAGDLSMVVRDSQTRGEDVCRGCSQAYPGAAGRAVAPANAVR